MLICRPRRAPTCRDVSGCSLEGRSAGRSRRWDRRAVLIDGGVARASVPGAGGGKELKTYANSAEERTGGGRGPGMKRLPETMRAMPSRNNPGRQGKGPAGDGPSAPAAEGAADP